MSVLARTPFRLIQGGKFRENHTYLIIDAQTIWAGICFLLLASFPGLDKDGHKNISAHKLSATPADSTSLL